MADIRPFRGVRYDPRRAPIARVLCPPYDVISKEQAGELRRTPLNAVHLELPEGGVQTRYARSARTWRRWNASGVLVRDLEPSIYVCEESFRIDGRTRKRLGLMAAMGLTRQAARQVVRHENTLAKPKADRLRLIKTVGAHLSPIFGLVDDRAGAMERFLRAVSRRPPVLGPARSGGISYRLWRLTSPGEIAAVRRALASKDVFIADGHHRYAASRSYWAQTRRGEADAILIYLCADQDPGLVVLGTHRVVARPDVAERAARLCRMTRLRSLKALSAALDACRSPYAVGICQSGYWLAEPRERGVCRSGLSVEWIGKALLKDVSPEDIRYTPDAAKAERWAREANGAAVLVGRLEVGQIRRAAEAVGLLPQKSTYFYPKVATGLVFKALRRP